MRHHESAPLLWSIVIGLFVLLVTGCTQPQLRPVVLVDQVDVDRFIGPPVAPPKIPPGLPEFDPVPIETGTICTFKGKTFDVGPGVLTDQRTNAFDLYNESAHKYQRTRGDVYQELRNTERKACQQADVAWQEKVQRQAVQLERARWSGPVGILVGIILGIIATDAAK